MINLTSIDEIELLKSDVPLYYIKNYQGTAHFSRENKPELDLSITFVLEMEPMGTKKINVTINDSVDYPLLPLIKQLKEEIRELDQRGRLL